MNYPVPDPSNPPGPAKPTFYNQPPWKVADTNGQKIETQEGAYTTSPEAMLTCFDWGAVVEGMLGGSPAKYPEPYAQASAIKMLPLGTPQILMWGDRDDILPLAMSLAGFERH
jgi:hypothetical protein